MVMKNEGSGLGYGFLFLSPYLFDPRETYRQYHMLRKKIEQVQICLKVKQKCLP
jgi:hypothetical protein